MVELLSNEWVLTVVALLLAVALVVPGLRLLWRASIQPSVLSQMEATLTSQQARMDRLRATLDEQQTEIDELREEMAADREEMAEMRVEMAEWRAGMKLVFNQLKAANIIPAWQPKERPRRPKRGAGDATLAGRIALQFNIEEMNGLAYDIGVLPEEFGGETKEARARELVELTARRGIAAALLARVKELRPNEEAK